MLFLGKVNFGNKIIMKARACFKIPKTIFEKNKIEEIGDYT